ncbi:D-2-hydroxyacid dehydrogenase family protein [Bradyrhizobium sp. INPA01-394B]|uniref:D-2-hydroxyacid dehydrogenase family protein n=1 Tax=Bradyrhizobium campsiandrae TaxID=1729892 RepID=A0ABR7UBS6_9BRAD|nr:D-2-hydroxyacid dehydrogenase family protein [Bradyrhizobium campsiandrae]MBC9878633.1 D-2-hydroxyacid dehydrogenase family protein [Bradyrhizobium campsiandrae]MBC9980638.1 D-2-hydroxyacid dehydrogenase family protein [Bradyrhizobium campsiandrae]
MPSVTPLRVAVLDDFQDVARSLADWSGLEPRATTTFFNDNVTGDALLARLLPFDVIMLIRERTKLPASLIARLPNLKLVVTAGMRNLGIDLPACRARKIPVCGTDTGSSSTAELAFAMLLALSRNIVIEDRALREGRWQTRMGRAVKGSTLGVLGLGRLGTQMAGYGRAFGMDVIAWSQNLTPKDAAAGGAVFVEKDELFRRSDFISLHVVLSERTRHVVGAADLARMKPSACLINTSRSGLVDEAALIAALKDGRIAGAALDVFDVEPLPHDAPILSAPNTLLTPHLGYASRDSYKIYFSQAVEDIAAWLDGKPIRELTA